MRSSVTICHGIAIVLGLIAAMVGASATAGGEATEHLLGGESCGLVDGEAGIVESVIDGDTLRLEGGLEVRLAGIQAPKLPLGRPDFEPWPFADAAKAELERLALGKAALLRYGGTRRDRYGRALAQVVVPAEAGEPLWLQRAMLEAGLARVYSFADNRECIGRLIEAERASRRSGLGLWADPYYAIRNAADPALANRRDVYDLVEGRVVSVGERGPIVYLDFGRDWRVDFTAVLTSEATAAMMALSGPADALAGRRVRIRGWIEQHDGPSVRVTHPEQIELLGDE